MPVDAPLYPANLVISGWRCLVVGGGRVATRKADGLLSCGALVTVVAPEVEADLATRPGVTVEVRPFRPDDTRGYRLAIAAAGDPTVNAAVHADGEANGVLVNSADDPAHCAFTLPAVVRRGRLMITVSTGGHSPALATWMRRQFEAEIGPEYDTLLELLVEERQRAQAAGVPTEDLDWQKALDSDMLGLIRAGEVQLARERLQACLSSPSA